MEEFVNYYEVLEITENASPEVIKAAYKALVKLYHPDSGRSSNEEIIKRINEAYSILSDSKARKEYNELLKMHKRESFKENPNEAKTSGSADLNDEDVVHMGKTNFGEAMHFLFRGVSREIQRNNQIIENEYLKGILMDNYELVHAFKNNYGLKRKGYEKVLVERGLLIDCGNGTLRPARAYQYYWR